MFRNSIRTRGVTVLLQRTLTLVSIIMLSVGSAGQVTTARAAPPAQTITNMRFYLNVAYPGKLCAGAEHSIRVTPLVDLDGEINGKKVSYKGRMVTGVPITAEVTDTSIATVDPAKPKSLQSGSLPASLWETLSVRDQENFGNLGEVVFKLKAKKAGTTNFYLTAEVPRQWSGSTKKYFGPQQMPTGGAIKVVNCEYRVIADYWWVFSGEWGRTWNSGYLNTKIKASDPEFYGGDGSFDFLLRHFDITGCHRTIGYQYPVHITGHLNNNDELELTLNIGTPSGTIAETCPNSFLLANTGFAAAAEKWQATPLLFPSSGGTKSFTFVAPTAIQGLPTQGLPPAKVTISVQPVEAGGN